MTCLLRTIALLGITVGASYAVGCAFRRRYSIPPLGKSYDFLSGLTILLLIFYIECITGICLRISLTHFVFIYSVSVLFLATICICVLVLRKKTENTFIVRVKNNNQKTSEIMWIKVAVILMIAFQTFMLVVGFRSCNDDTSYVAIATTAIHTDTLYEYSEYTEIILDNQWSYFKRILSPWNLFSALICKYTGIHVAIISHTLLPLVLIPLAYLVYYNLARQLLHKRNEQWYFMLFLCIVHLFGAYSQYTVSVRLLARIWQGNAIYAAIFLPWLLLVLILICKYHKRYYWILLFFSAVLSILFTNVAVVNTMIIIVAVTFAHAYRKKALSVFLYGLLCCLPCLICGGIILFFASHFGYI